MSKNYVSTVLAPFSKEAEGGQVPDMYSFPTQTSVLRTQFTLSTMPNSSDLDFVLQPNIYACLAVSFPSASVVTATAPVSGGNQWFQSVPVTAAGVNGFVEYGVATPNQMAAQYARYRVVGYGVRIKSILPPLTQQGSIVATQIPSVKEWMNFNCQVNANYLEVGGSGGQFQPPTNGFIPQDPQAPPDTANNLNIGAEAWLCGGLYPAQTDGITTVPLQCSLNPSWASYLQFYEMPGVDNSGFLTQTMLALPVAHQMTVPGLTLDNGMTIIGRQTSPGCYGWRNPGNNPGSFTSTALSLVSGDDPVSVKTTYTLGQQMLCDTSALVPNLKIAVGGAGVTSTQNNCYNNQIVGMTDEDYVFQDGWSTLCFRAAGLPKSTTAQAVFTLDIVFHIEGVPFCGSSSVVSGARYPFYSAGALEQVAQLQSAEAFFKKGIYIGNSP